ncbi:hypothetical protein K1T71_007721 [Dendrolimus kikuchii]|uniref:Uncharacterized protein n=1 Tax=Dendrolimus kikuchii TaxID=765133 RepID=A0ACC1CZI6_9NEOP|nr:hypothetical protein K1T71_007721 [Dendrolimus kikuchii]
MLPVNSPRKKIRSPIIDSSVNLKTSVTCTNVPEGLFDANTAKKHFNKFGRVQRIRLLPKRHMCIIEYEQPISAERAVLNAGAFEGFMFDVTRTKARVRRKSKKEDDPDWVPDSDVEEELSAMAGAPTYRITRQKSMDVEPVVRKVKPPVKIVKQPPIRRKIVAVGERKSVAPSTSITESPVVVTISQMSMSTYEAAAELHQLRSKVSLTPDEQWRILDTRDRILRAWGGAGSRIKVGGATIGTCPDMCPEKELLHRQAEHQVMTLETVLDSDGVLEPWRAVKQYSRSSADQEMPMCYELRPAKVLMRTCAYLLHEIADTTRQVTLADWFHFMWDRLRGIRKDITQQALCCSESIRLVEMCARFHAHCAARLADLEHTQFDQKLNTDNLTKCLQTLKHMYADVGPEEKPKEAEFRGYIALLNLGDANFWWEIKQLPHNIQKAEPIIFAIQIFNALDNNNYVRFFRLVKERATYLQACILLRYFNDVRARALARVVKAYAPRGGSRFPAQDLMNALAFESVENMKSFINHYGLRFAKTDDTELFVILDRNQFIEDSDPYPIARAVTLIESRRRSTVGKVIAGGELPNVDHEHHKLYSSFNKDGKLKESALTAEDQGYNTINDSNKDVQGLKAEIQRLDQGGKTINSVKTEPKLNLFVKPEVKSSFPIKVANESKLFSFKPAIPVAPTEIIHNSPEKIFAPDVNNVFLFSKPENTSEVSSYGIKLDGKLSKSSGQNLFAPVQDLYTKNVLKQPMKNDKLNQNVFGTSLIEGAQKSQDTAKSIFGQTIVDNKNINTQNNLFSNTQNKNIFSKKDGETSSQNVFGKSIFANNKENNLFSKPDSTVKFEKGSSIFSKPSLVKDGESIKPPSNIFGTINKSPESYTSKFSVNNQIAQQSIFASNNEDKKLSPSSLFKSICNQPNGSDNTNYSIFQSKNKAQTVADNIFMSVVNVKSTVYEFNQNDEEKQAELQRINEERIKEEEQKMQEKLKKEEEKRREELRRREEIKRKEEERKKQELKRLEEKRKAEERKKQEELRKKLEEERQAELKRKAEEEERKFKAAVDKESTDLVEELTEEIRDETIIVILKEEVENLKNLMHFANNLTDDIINELGDEICISEMKAEIFRTEKVMRKWFQVWKENYIRNCKRRSMLDDTPVWLPNNTPVEEATHLRRVVENVALKNMNAFHKGYVFVGELKQIPPPEPYNIMEIIKSPLLKRMKTINYPYDKCFFWKVTLVSPGETKWLYRKINVKKWLFDAFSDKKKHDESENLIHVSKQSWNHLMDFAISVSLTNRDKLNSNDAVEGANGIVFYFTENEINKEMELISNIQEILHNGHPYQVIPVSIIMPKPQNSVFNKLETYLIDCVKNNKIKTYRIFVIDTQNVSESLNTSTKSAMKWMAKNYPQNPPIEIDYLKSICQRYLGNEIWCRFKSEKDPRINTILKDLEKLVQIYNIAVDKLTEVITDEDLFNYPSFPLEFRQFLDMTSPYPKPYEFVPSNVKNSSNILEITDAMNQLKLPKPVVRFNPINVMNMQKQIRTYSNQIGWFQDPEQVVCKVIAKLPNEFADLDMSNEDFSKHFANCNIIDFLNVIVYEKINSLKYFDKLFAIYKRSVLDTYRNADWLFEINLLKEMKHKAIEDEDEIDFFIEAKRRKIAMNSIELLMLEDKDSTMVEENIKRVDVSISKYNDCTEAMKELEMQLEEGKKKSLEFENLLKAALSEL